MRNLAPVLLAMMLALGAVACGGNDAQERNAYAAAVNRAQTGFASRFRTLSARISGTTSASQGRRALQGFQHAVDGVLARLQSIRPPTGLHALHRRLIGQMREYGREIAKAKAAFRTRTPATILDAQNSLVRATTAISARINRTVAAINRKLQS
jgi:hypothetical protein